MPGGGLGWDPPLRCCRLSGTHAAPQTRLLCVLCGALCRGSLSENIPRSPRQRNQRLICFCAVCLQLRKDSRRKKTCPLFLASLTVYLRSELGDPQPPSSEASGRIPQVGGSIPVTHHSAQRAGKGRGAGAGGSWSSVLMGGHWTPRSFVLLIFCPESCLHTDTSVCT